MPDSPDLKKQHLKQLMFWLFLYFINFHNHYHHYQSLCRRAGQKFPLLKLITRSVSNKTCILRNNIDFEVSKVPVVLRKYHWVNAHLITFVLSRFLSLYLFTFFTVSTVIPLVPLLPGSKQPDLYLGGAIFSRFITPCNQFLLQSDQ